MTTVMLTGHQLNRQGARGSISRIAGGMGAHVSLSNDIKSDEPANRVWLVRS